MAWGSCITTTPTLPPPQLWDGSVSNSYRPSPVGPQQGSFCLVLLVPLEPGLQEQKESSVADFIVERDELSLEDRLYQAGPLFRGFISREGGGGALWAGALQGAGLSRGGALQGLGRCAAHWIQRQVQPLCTWPSATTILN